MAERVQEAIEETIQGRARGRETALSFIFWMAGGNEIISPWWSRQRDAELRRFVKQVDYLSGTVSTLETMLTTIPIEVVPKNLQIRAHVKQAQEFTDILENESNFAEGWGNTFSQVIEDLVTQDNGYFIEVIGEGEADGPIVGRPIGIAHLDSWRCRRTGNPTFPVVYFSSDGNIFKLHYTRVIFGASMPSPNEVMYGVGFCAVSRSINVAQNLLDMLIFKQEKLGSRPQRQILVASGGLDPDDVSSAFEQANENMDNQRLSRYSRTVVVGASGLENAALDAIDLSSLPDGFDEESSVSMGMAAIALAFGLDPREIWPGQTSGSTRAEALISHIKQRGKGPGQIIQMMERKFNFKFLPAHLELRFDFQDDAQDAQIAEIRNTRSTFHMRDLELGLLDTRTVREQMVTDGDLSRAQFERLELDDGRTADGRDVLALFFDPELEDDLALGVTDPLDFKANDPRMMQDAIGERRGALMAELSAANPGRRQELERAIAALDRLAMFYGGVAVPAMTGTQEPPKQLPKPAGDDEEPDPTGNMDLNQDDLALKTLMDPADAITRAAQAVERVNKRVLTLIPTSDQEPVTQVNGPKPKGLTIVVNNGSQGKDGE